MTLAIFNPEHDLCLANGRAHYVPPASALKFARTGISNMRTLYGEKAHVITAEDYGDWYDETGIVPDKIIPWGWDARLKWILLKQGCPESLLPSDEWLETLRQLQHRSTIAALQPHASCANTLDDIELKLHEPHDGTIIQQIVLKAPWSGAGRGIRFVKGEMTEHDKWWAKKVIEEQRCVIVERRLNVKDEFAIEYWIEDGVVRETGLSLFVSQSGVYRENILLTDDEIRHRVGLSQEVEDKIMKWINDNVAWRYEGPLGVDLILDNSGETYISEFNFRHTMGMVAHEKIKAKSLKLWDL